MARTRDFRLADKCALLICILIVLAAAGCDGGAKDSSTDGRSSEFDVLTGACARGITEVELKQNFAVVAHTEPGLYIRGSSEQILSNIHVSTDGRVVQCCSWLGDPDDMFWSVMIQVLSKRYGRPLSVQINQAMWISGIRLERRLPDFDGRVRGEMVLIWEDLNRANDIAAQPDVIRSASGAAMVMVDIPAGSFMIGSPTCEENRDNNELQHRVEITQAFQMSSTEVTQAQYEKVMGNNPSSFKGADRPVEKVSWYDAVRFCNALSIGEGLTPAYDILDDSKIEYLRAANIVGDVATWDARANGYRLPTEAEWEYACRAGTTTAYHTGDSEGDLSRAGWYDGNAGGETHPVGKRTPNAWGLYDMHGNVWEWCWDLYEGYPSGAQKDPQGGASGYKHVSRGGGWYNDAGSCRSADRSMDDSFYAFSYLGFRVARSSIR